MATAGIIRRGKLSEQLADHLIDQVVDGTLAPDDALPTERHLSQRHGVSIHVVREAVKRLAAIGLVDIRHGVGMFVAPRERWNTSAAIMMLVRADPSVVLDMHDVRAPLELLAVERAAKYMTAIDVAALDAALYRMGRALDDPAAFVAADLEFHLAIARGTHNRILLPALQPLIEPIHEHMLRGALIPRAAARAYAEHEEIATGLRARKARQAVDAMRRHLETTRGELESLTSFARRADARAGPEFVEGSLAGGAQPATIAT